jgi:hypothetical protein
MAKSDKLSSQPTPSKPSPDKLGAPQKGDRELTEEELEKASGGIGVYEQTPRETG